MDIFRSEFDDLLTQERKKYRLLPSIPILIIGYTLLVALVSLGVALLNGPVFLLIPWGILAIGASIFYPRRIYGSMLTITLILEGFALWTISNSPLSGLATDFTGIMVSFILSELFHYLTINRLRAAEAHKDTETKYRILVEQANDGIVMVQNSKFLYANEQFARMLGYKTDELTQQSIEICANSESVLLMKQIAKITSADIEKRFSETIQLQHKDGHSVDVEVNISLANHQGIPTIFAVARDVTARQAAEAKLRQTTLELNLLNKLNHAANQDQSLNKIFAMFSQETMQLFSTHGAIIFLFDGDNKTKLFIQRNSQPISAKAQRWIEKLVGINLTDIHLTLTPNSLYQQSLDADRPTLFTKPDEIQQMMIEFAVSMLPPGDFLQKVLQSTIPKIYKYLEIASVLHLPLATEGEVLGLIEFSGGKTNDFYPERISGLENIARQLATIIKHKRIQDALAYSESLYVSLVENIPLNIFRKDHNGRITFVNQNYCQTEGKSLDEILGKTDFDIHPPELAEKYRQEDQHVMESGETLKLTEIHQPLGGDVIYVRTVKTPLYDGNGAIVGIQGVFEDITSQRENEIRLRYYAERLNMLHKIDQAILNAQSLESVAQSALEPILHLIPAERTSVTLIDEASGIGKVLAIAGNILPENLKVGAVFPLETFPVYRRYQMKRQKILRGIYEESEVRVGQILKQNQINAAINVMLLVDGELVGALNIGFTNPDDMLEEYDDILEEISDSLAVALRQIKLTERIKKEAEAKTRLLQEVDHRVKNNLANIVGMIYLELRYAKQNNTPISIQTLEMLNVRVRNLAVVHEMLARNEWHPLHLRSLASEVFNTTLRTLVPAGKELIADIEQSDILIMPEHAQDFTLIFSEIAANVAQFVMVDRNKLTVYLSFEEKGEYLQIVYRANDMLHPKSIINERPNTPNLTLLTQTIEHTLRGTLEILNDNNDALVIVRIPLEFTVGIETND